MISKGAYQILTRWIHKKTVGPSKKDPGIKTIKCFFRISKSTAQVPWQLLPIRNHSKQLVVISEGNRHGVEWRSRSHRVANRSDSSRLIKRSSRSFCRTTTCQKIIAGIAKWAQTTRVVQLGSGSRKRHFRGIIISTTRAWTCKATL